MAEPLILCRAILLLPTPSPNTHSCLSLFLEHPQLHPTLLSLHLNFFHPRQAPSGLLPRFLLYGSGIWCPRPVLRRTPFPGTQVLYLKQRSVQGTKPAQPVTPAVAPAYTVFAEFHIRRGAAND